MISQLFLDVMQILVVTLLIFVCLTLVKRVFTSFSGSVGKATDDSESSNLNVNFMAWDSRKRMKKKMDLLFGLNDERKKFVFERFQKILKDAEEEQTKGKRKLNSVG